MGAAVGPGDYHGTMTRAELEREAGGSIFNAGSDTETRGQVDRTRYQGQDQRTHGGSSGSSGSYRSSSSSETSHSSSQSGSAGSSSLDSNDVVQTTGGKWVWSESSQKWEWEAEAGAGASSAQDSGEEDTGWKLLPNGTWARKSSSWSRSSHSQSSRQEGGSLGTGVVLPGGGPGERGHHGNNNTGWVEMPDGTMVKKTAAWASWSGSSYGGLADSDLESVQRGLEQRVRSHLPGNVEPGYEQQWRSRSKRSLAEFESELARCGARCTVIKCTVGPLEKDESVLFKVRSRLFTETQVKNYAEKVKISSKLVTRVTRLPFLVPEEHLASQSHQVTRAHSRLYCFSRTKHSGLDFPISYWQRVSPPPPLSPPQVTTTVIPSEPGEVGIPWWVWLLAALGGILLLALITYCLYKVLPDISDVSLTLALQCGFFKRRRPEGGPETEPLQSNGSVCLVISSCLMPHALLLQVLALTASDTACLTD
jgi:hypothetical protein